MMLNKIILTDIDGVVLNWIDSFVQWMGVQGYQTNNDFNQDHYKLHDWFQITEEEIVKLIARFNESVHIGFLPPMPEAITYIRKLHEHGYKFRGITSMGDNIYSHYLRKQNINRLFGSAFEDVICLPLRGCKKTELEKHYTSFGPSVTTLWIEDHVHNAKAGADVGLWPIMYAHRHNKDWDGDRLQSWKEIYEYILDFENKFE